MLSLFVALPLAAPQSLISDELLVSAFSSDSITRHDATSGAFELEYGPSPLTGSLGFAVGLDGALYACSETTDEVLRFHAVTGAYLGPFVFDDPATPQDETGGLDGPSGIVFGPDGMAYVASFEGDAVLRYDGRSGAFDSVFVLQGAAGLNGPDAGLAFGPNGDLYVPSYWSSRVKRYDGASGAFVEDFATFASSGLLRPRTVLFAPGGLVYVTSEGSDEVLELDLAGTFLRALVTDDPATVPNETGGLDAPTGMAIGPDGRLYVASLQTDEVLRYELATGAFAGVFVAAGAGGIDAPTFLAFRPRAGSYCPGASNSVGPGGAIVAHGFTGVAADRFELRAAFLPPGEAAVFFYGRAEAALPLGAGTLCIGGDLFRLPATLSDASGQACAAVPLGSAPRPAGVISAGSTWHFQLWYRDGGGTNLTDAVRATFHP